MGEVKETVKGQGLKTTPVVGKPKVKGDNLVEMLESLKEEVSKCIQKKDNDALTEGEAEKAENVRKAALLRGVHSMLSSSLGLLEDY